MSNTIKLDEVLKKKNLILKDGILAHIVRKKGKVYKVRVVGKMEESWLIVDGEYSAHGETLSAAQNDLMYKRASKDLSVYEGWTAKKKVTLDEAVVLYRAVTGACSSGVKMFLEGKKYPKTFPIQKIIDETKGQYGHDKFKEFFSR